MGTGILQEEISHPLWKQSLKAGIRTVHMLPSALWEHLWEREDHLQGREHWAAMLWRKASPLFCRVPERISLLSALCSGMAVGSCKAYSPLSSYQSPHKLTLTQGLPCSKLGMVHHCEMQSEVTCITTPTQKSTEIKSWSYYSLMKNLEKD